MTNFDPEFIEKIQCQGNIIQEETKLFGGNFVKRCLINYDGTDYYSTEVNGKCVSFGIKKE